MSTAATDRAAPPRQTRRASSETEMTSRGVGVLAAGIVIAVLGVGLSTPILVYIGVAMTCAVAVAWIWLVIAVDAFLRVIPATRREVSPHPLTAGVPGTVSVTIDSRAGGRHVRMRRSVTEHLDLREQAAAELTGGAGTKATVTRGDGTLTLRYSLHPTRRGRWPLGPALVHSGDPFGMIHADTPVGEPQLVPVWPAVVDLSGTAGALMGHADRVVLGARTPSPDDASLRDYREGDDLRRVHWASSARLGTMLVRSDERAGRRPATVILDPPREPIALEWAISAAASIALSVLDSGHPVRMIGAGLDAGAVRHLGERGGEAARYELLNQTIDLRAPASRADSTAQVVRSAALAADDARQGEVTVGVLEPLSQEALDALVPIGDSGRAWALVRTGPAMEADARRTVRGLRRAGWRATTISPTDDLAELWTRMLTAGEIE
ncbi:DUF58 domain-containing protein [Demequina muriae]|uniref:DUF58 domain-containing protein n=1 Tax=Demequina muriae TaxID=3051664 RepID=A0ABT8GDU8_9MICO|nr:DUF58 domain-containing protein [Demequina sp. EGI L300058]MDN4479529.1 DUF58 domain-containing protein [Demequina sp. EGI L300058]